ncbi:MAG: ATP synthase F1 subunit epsilon [Candidatus Binatus sp.]|jgi:F-type H+-transporting ATPase subunit epsilon|uniref:ATP synthase F1 subunit epsilon n=1 Tax=Candidatus Binatus sp. TaxID=2811406 RepID=UPI003D0A6D40
MAGTFSFTLVTPTGVVAEGQAEEVSAIGPLGEFGVLPDHINFITSLVPGVLEARLPDGVAMHWVVSGGLAEVKDGVMTVLASSAESPESIDANAAAAQVRQADEIFSSLSFYDPEYAPAQEALMLARARVEAAALKPTPR